MVSRGLGYVYKTQDKKRPIFEGAPRDVDYKKWRPGDVVQTFDGDRLRDVLVEPMMLARAAHARGPNAVVELMGKHTRNLYVQFFCLQSLAKFDIDETDEGHASVEARRMVQAILAAMEVHPNTDSVQAQAIAAMAGLAQNYANRDMINHEEWLGPTLKAMRNLKMDRYEIIERNADGNRKVTVEEPTRQSCEVVLHGARMLQLMACDPGRRQLVAEESLNTLISAMKFCNEDATVQLYGCLALYNFVYDECAASLRFADSLRIPPPPRYRCELAHVAADEEGALAVVNAAVAEFPTDCDLLKIATRTQRALEPRGGAARTTARPESCNMGAPACVTLYLGIFPLFDEQALSLLTAYFIAHLRHLGKLDLGRVAPTTGPGHAMRVGRGYALRGAATDEHAGQIPR